LKVGIVAVGRLKGGLERDLVDRYRQRFTAAARPLGLSGLVVRELAESPARAAAERKAQEAAAILQSLQPDATAVRLDERGDAITSADFAAMIGKARDSGTRDFTLIIGGPDGLGTDVAARAPRAIGFGRMTMPHQIVRVLVLEQLYRAATIMSGHPYHRE
jgi:23S rRNA (pseudouridine1915-N3)-methyltransferase